MSLNFRANQFEGNLLNLLETCWNHMPKGHLNIKAHDWLKEQIASRDNILLIRKFSPGFNVRGECRETEGGIVVMPVDNEPLAALYKEWTAGQISNVKLKDLLRPEPKIPASWRCDAEDRMGFKFGGVNSQFRNEGLKLAHISDAARGLGGSVDESTMKIRFMRYLSPLNVFLFPSSRAVSFELVSTDEIWRPRQKDWAEDEWIRSVALGWLLNKIGHEFQFKSENYLVDFGDYLPAHPNWKRAAECTQVRVAPKSMLNRKKNVIKKAVSHIYPSNERDSVCPKISSTEAVSFEEAVELLRAWLSQHPGVKQLNGKDGSDPTPWLHFEVSGYKSPNDDFQSSDGDEFFSGEDYNGIVNFHGDAKAEKIAEFIKLIDTAEDYHDVLRPSQTQQYNGHTKPKFALKGWDGKVDGFYLYHGDWNPKKSKKAS